MASYPGGWTSLSLGDVASVQGGFAFKSNSFADVGVPIVRMSNLKKGKLALIDAARVPFDVVEALHKFRLDAGDLLLGLTGSIENYALVEAGDLPCYLNQRVGRFGNLEPAKLHYPYLYHLIRTESFKEAIRILASGAAQLNVSPKRMGEISILLPPLPEQRKIAAILSSVDDTIEKTEDVIEQLQVVKKAMMQELLTRGLPGRHRRFKKTEIGVVPEGWALLEVADIGQIVTGGTPKTNNSSYWDGDIPFITPGDLGKARVIEDSLRTVSHDGLRASRELPASTILVVSIGSSIGKIGMINRTACTNQQINGVICSEAHIPAYVYYALVAAKGQITSNASQTAVPIINKTRFGAIRISIPSKREQQEIAASLCSVDDQIETERLVVGRLMRLKASLMSVLLTGEVRVTLDVHDR